MQKLKGYLDIKEGEIVGIASTEKMDRDGEVIKQDGWDLSNFKKNPVLLASHNYHEFPIGKATNIKVEDKRLVFKAVFSQATQKAIEAYQLVKEGILKSFSVGFIPREYDEKDRSVITKAELLEISLVAVPANPQAIVTAKEFKDNSLAKELVKMWLLDEETKKSVTELEEDEGEQKDMMTGLKKIRKRMSGMADDMSSMVSMMDSMMDEGKSVEGEDQQNNSEEENNPASGSPDTAQTPGEEGGPVEDGLDGKVLQRAITYLQQIRTQQKRKEVEK